MRCKGKTKAGARCKRNSSEGSDYCATHADQATQSEPETADSSADDMFGGEAEPATNEWSNEEVWDTLREVAVVGTVIVAALVFGRWIKVI